MKTFVLITFAIIAVIAIKSVTGAPPGAVGASGSSEKDATDDVKKFIAHVSKEILESEPVKKAGATGEVTALKFADQVVSGTNYFVKVKIGDKVFHVYIYKGFGKADDLSVVHFKGAKGPVEESEPVKYFTV